jgi:membrane-associated phospholipid phosphatase
LPATGYQHPLEGRPLSSRVAGTFAVVSDALSVKDHDVEPDPLAAHPQRHRWLEAALTFVVRRHRPLVEAVILVVLYQIYNLSRGLVSAGRSEAVAHAHHLITLERGLRIDVEKPVQRAAERIPGLVDIFDFEYATLHLVAAVAVLIWLYRKDATNYIRYRLALVLSCLGAVAVFTAWPTAPPRMAGISIADSLARSGVDPDSRTLTIFYNPYAAFPSLHQAFAVLVGFYLVHSSRTRLMRLVGVVYPLWIATEVMATGNHFLIDLVAGGLLAFGALWAAYRACPAQWGDLTMREAAIERAGAT